MDILQQYEKEKATNPTPQPPTQHISPEVRDSGFMVRLVMRVSGGAIQTNTQANIVIFFLALLCIAATFWVLKR